MANWAWLLLICLGHNLCCWAQELGALAAGRDGNDLRANRLRYRYLVVPAMVVRTARQLTSFESVLPAGGDHHLRSRSVENLGEPFTEAARRPGHDSDPTVDIKGVRSYHVHDATTIMIPPPERYLSLALSLSCSC